MADIRCDRSDAGICYGQISQSAAVLPQNRWQIKPYIPEGVTPQPNMWVQIQHDLDAIASQEALLLCRDANHWLAWIPDYGEIRLGLQAFEVLQ